MSYDQDSKLFIGNITYNTRERELEDIFREYGKIKEVRVAMDSSTGRSKGYAFLTMEDSRDAADAVKGVHGMRIDGREVRVEVCHGNGPRAGGGGGGDRFGSDRGRYGDRDRDSYRDRDNRYNDDRRDRSPDRRDRGRDSYRERSRDRSSRDREKVQRDRSRDRS